MHTLYIRPERSRILFFAAIWLVGGSFAVYRGASPPGNDIVDVTLTLCLVVAAIPAAANFLCFHYVSVGEGVIRQVQFFGIVNRTLHTEEVTRVEEGSVRPTIFTFKTIRIRSRCGLIEFIPEYYERGAVREAVRRLSEAGVPMDEGLVRMYVATRV